MSKICQKYLFLFSIGLLPLIPLVVGCQWFVSEPQPTPIAVDDPVIMPLYQNDPVVAEQVTAAETEAEAARLAAELEIARLTMEIAAAQRTTEGEVARRAEAEAKRRVAEVELARRAAEAEAARIRAELESTQQAWEAEAARLQAELEVVRQATEAETVVPHADAPGTDGIDRTSPVDQTSPVDTTPPVQGGNFSLTYAEREPMTVFVSQVDQLEINVLDDAQLEDEVQTTVNVVPPRGQGADRMQPPMMQGQMAQGQMTQGQMAQGQMAETDMTNYLFSSAKMLQDVMGSVGKLIGGIAALL